MLLAAMLAATVNIPPAPLPPAQYDKPYTGRLIERRVSLSRMSGVCGGPAWACAYPMGATCIIYLPSESRGAQLARLRRHEVGHCNGWPAHHPGGRA